MKNKLILSLEDYPELEEFFSRKSPGDTGKMEVSYTIDSIVDKTASLSVGDVEYEGDDEEVVEEEGEEMSDKMEGEPPPVAIVLGVSKKKKE